MIDHDDDDDDVSVAILVHNEVTGSFAPDVQYAWLWRCSACLSVCKCRCLRACRVVVGGALAVMANSISLAVMANSKWRAALG